MTAKFVLLLFVTPSGMLMMIDAPTMTAVMSVRQLTAAGRRVLDLLENQWMTDVTHVLSQSGDSFTVRGFHGDYEVHVTYRGRELSNLKKTFTLGKAAHTVSINVHT